MKKLLQILALALAIGACKGETPIELPLLTIDDLTLMEGDATTNFDFRVRISAPAVEVVTFTYTTVAGTATAGEDFVAIVDGSGRIEVGSSETTIRIEVLGDQYKENDETFSVLLGNVAGAEVAKSTGYATIRNDDTEILIDDTGYTTPASYAGYDLVWGDEFDGTALNTADWTYEYGNSGWGNNELQNYTNRPENLFFSGGKMIIEARNERFGGSNYTSSRIKTQGKRSFQYGRIDVRAKLPEGQGIWPAIWMLGESISTVGWPACGEIDIMELVGHEPGTTHATVHFGENFSVHQYRGTSSSLGAGKKFSDEFHVFSLNWEENLMEFFLDDQKFFTVTPATTQGFPYPFNDEFFFIMNIAVGGNWPGSPNASTVFPQQMQVDYVRVFQKQ
ncbi:MAG: hypothetical protein OHK0039_22040 [Bacteroidia bacterium]